MSFFICHNFSFRGQYSLQLNVKILKPEFEDILHALINDLRVKILRRTHDVKFAMVIDNYENKVSRTLFIFL